MTIGSIITLTKQGPAHTPAPAPQGDGAPDIVVTEEMRRAGAEELDSLTDRCPCASEFCEFSEIFSSAEKVEAIYTAMAQLDKLRGRRRVG